MNREMAADSVPSRSEGARLRGRYGAFLGIAVAGCAADWLTKYWIFLWPRGPGRNGEWWLIENYVGIQLAWNEGALWGIGQGYVTLFAVLSICAAIGILIWMVRGGAARDWLLTISLGAVLGGIFGNLHDRLGMWGDLKPDGTRVYAVRDWILFRYQDWTWPNFNIADCLLVGGAALLAWHAMRKPEGHGENA